jgi:hypothetical protein
MNRTAALIIGGVATIGTAVGALFASRKTTNTVKNAVAGLDKQGAPALPMGSGVTVPLRITGYWPYSARPDEMKMEGGTTGAAGWPKRRVVDPATGKRVVLTTVEMHRENPEKYPHVSLSGDPDVWPWGQKIVIPWSDGKPIVGRVVDTGQHFTGANKVFRIVGREPIDVCVASSSTKVIAKTDATVYPGEHWDKSSSDVAYAKVGKPALVGVSCGFDILDFG